MGGGEQPPISRYVWRPWVEKRTAFPTTTILEEGTTGTIACRPPPQRDFRPNNKPKRTSGSQILAILIEVHFGIYLWDAHDCLTPLTYQIVQFIL